MSELKPCPFCGNKDVGLSYTPGEEDWYVYCPKCDSRGSRSEEQAKCYDDWNKRAGEMFIPNRQLVMAAPRMYRLLKDYCWVTAQYVSIYDHFPDDLREIARQANEIITEQEAISSGKGGHHD